MWRVVAVMGLVLALMAGAGGLYFKWSQGELKKLNETVATQGVTIAAQQQGIDDLTGRINSIQRRQEDYNRNVNQIRVDTDKKRNEVAQISDPASASKQPRETEAVINTFTNSMFRDIESFSKDENLPKPVAPPAKKGK